MHQQEAALSCKWQGAGTHSRADPCTNGRGLTPQGTHPPPGLPISAAPCPGHIPQERAATANLRGSGGDLMKVNRQNHAALEPWLAMRERVISWMQRFDLARIKTQLSARRLTKIIVQLNKKNYLITQACSLVVKLNELQAYVNIAALQQHYFTEIVVLLEHARATLN